MASNKDYNLEQDLLKIYMNEVKQHPVLSAEEQKELTKKYKNGDLEAKQKLLNSNLRLVLTIAIKFKERLKHLKFLDIIQEGNIGLIRALETYDPEKGAFSTYAYKWIYQKIDRLIKNANKSIRTSVNLQEKKNKYLKLIDEYEKKLLPIPSDDKLCELLNITKRMLYKIRDSYIFDDESLNKSINDEEENELEKFINYNEQGFKKIENDIDNRLLLLTLKENLSPCHYYVLYYMVLMNDNSITLELVGNVFKISRERVRQIRDKAIEKSKKIMSNQKKYYHKLMNKYGTGITKLNPYPIEPTDIVKYLYVEQHLDVYEQRLLWILLVSKNNYSNEDLCYNLECTLSELDSIKEKLKTKLDKLFQDQTKYQRFEESTLKLEGTKIFNAIQKSVHITDFSKLKNKYSDLSYDDIIREFEQELNLLSGKEIELLRSYYTIPSSQKISKDFIERSINLELYGFKHKNIDLPKKVLCETLIKNKSEFTDEQFLYLECFYFCTKDRNLFEEKYPNRKRSIPKVYLKEKLERLYFGLNKIFENNFNLEKYIKIRIDYTKNKQYI